MTTPNAKPSAGEQTNGEAHPAVVRELTESVVALRAERDDLRRQRNKAWDERDALAAQNGELEDGLEQALDGWRTAVLHLPGNINGEIDRIAKLRILLAKHGR